MAATRTQVYLSQEQRRLIDELRRRDGTTLAQVVREALDAYLRVRVADADAALEASFGADPQFAAPPRGEWAHRRHG